MERTVVHSSSIRALGFSEDGNVLEVEFQTGTVYEYEGVPRAIYDALLGAASKGQYFDRAVRKGGYRFRRVR